MSDYGPGTVVRADGFEYPLMMGNGGRWVDANGERYVDSDLLRIRPLVALDLPEGALAGWHVVLAAFRRAREKTHYNMVFSGLIGQIEQQTQPPRPNEPKDVAARVSATVPGMDGGRSALIRVPHATGAARYWLDIADGATYRWDELTEIVLGWDDEGGDPS